jgi:hypothetical protein
MALMTDVIAAVALTTLSSRSGTELRREAAGATDVVVAASDHRTRSFSGVLAEAFASTRTTTWSASSHRRAQELWRWRWGSAASDSVSTRAALSRADSEMTRLGMSWGECVDVRGARWHRRPG